jgi:hypothetical protein
MPQASIVLSSESPVVRGRSIRTRFLLRPQLLTHA